MPDTTIACDIYDKKRRKALITLLKDLAKDEILFSSEAKINEFYHRLSTIYGRNIGYEFRHYYSDIFSVLSEIDQIEDSGGSLYDTSSIETVGSNIKYLFENYPNYQKNNPNTPDISSSLLKLYDHVSLDIARINYVKAAIWKESFNSNIYKLEDEVEGLKAKNEETIASFKERVDAESQKISEFAEGTKTEFDEFSRKLDSSQKDYISILGIFASIVLAFVGGLTFSTAVFNNIHTTSIYKLLVVALVVGLVFITIIFMMFHYIGVITQRYSENSYPPKPLWISYGVIMILIVLVLISWKFGAIEERNKNIYYSYSDNNATQIPSESEASDLPNNDEPIITDTVDSLAETTNCPTV